MNMNARSLVGAALQPGASLREVEPGLYSLYLPGAGANAYDESGALAFYDRIACNALYNRLMWGYATPILNRLCRQALASRSEGWVLDAGCGSLAFTAPSYTGFTGRPVIFLDQSLTLLRRVGL